MRACSSSSRTRRRATADLVAGLVAGLAGVLGAGGPAEAQAQAQDRTAVRIATNVERLYSPPVETLLRKAYASMGLQVEYLAWPLTRQQVELRSGNLDGVALRAETYFDQTPTVRKVDVPLLTFSLYAYGRPPCPASITLEELNRHRVSVQRGMVAAEALVPEANRVPANTPSDAFTMVGSGSADFVLTLTMPWMAELPVDTRHGTLCKIDSPLGRTVMYHGVHESRAAWVAPLEQALRRMREKGEIQQAWAEYERQIRADNHRLQAQPGRSLTVTPAASAARMPP